MSPSDLSPSLPFIPSFPPHNSDGPPQDPERERDTSRCDKKNKTKTTPHNIKESTYCHPSVQTCPSKDHRSRTAPWNKSPDAVDWPKDRYTGQRCLHDDPLGSSSQSFHACSLLVLSAIEPWPDQTGVIPMLLYMTPLLQNIGVRERERETRISKSGT